MLSKKLYGALVLQYTSILTGAYLSAPYRDPSDQTTLLVDMSGPLSRIGSTNHRLTHLGIKRLSTCNPCWQSKRGNAIRNPYLICLSDSWLSGVWSGNPEFGSKPGREKIHGSLTIDFSDYVTTLEQLSDMNAFTHGVIARMQVDIPCTGTSYAAVRRQRTQRKDCGG